MLTRLLSHARHNFARTTKQKQLADALNNRTEQKSDDTMQDNLGEVDGEGGKINKINKRDKQRSKVLKSQINKLVKQGFGQQQIINKYIPKNVNKKQQSQLQFLEQMLESGEDSHQIREQELVKLKQQMLINQIVKKQKNKKQVALKFADLGTQQPDQNKQERIYNEIHRLHNGSQIKQLTFEEKMKDNYSQNLIKVAEQQKNQELSYFKQLMKQNYIVQHKKPQKLHPLHRRLNKGETYAQMMERQKRQNSAHKKQSKQIHLFKQQLEDLELKQKQRKKSISQQLVAYEDENYYKQKALKQFQTRSIMEHDPQNKQYLEAGQRDMEEAGDLSNILVDQYDDSEDVQLYKKHLYQKSSFGLIDAKVNDLQKKLKKHGIDLEIEQIKDFKKEILFNQKKQRQQHLAYQKFLQKKQIKNKTKEYFNKVHAQKLREDLDFQKDYQNRYEDIKYDPLDVQGNIQKAKQISRQRNSSVLGKDKSQAIHFQKTERKMRNFISSFFYQDLFNPNQKLYHKIYISDMKFNEKKTVASIFWSFQDYSLSQNKEQIQKMGKKLAKSAQFMSGKMTQVLGLRYGPDIRFLYDYILPQTHQIKQSLQQNKNQVISFQLQNLINKGYIKTQKQLVETKKKLEIVAQQNIENYHNRKILITKKFKQSLEQKQDKKTKKERKNNKKKADERFWQRIDKL